MDMGSIPRSRRSPGGGNGNPLQYSCLENPIDRGAWWAVVHRVANSWTWLKWLRSSSKSNLVCTYNVTPADTVNCCFLGDPEMQQCVWPSTPLQRGVQLTLGVPSLRAEWGPRDAMCLNLAEDVGTGRVKWKSTYFQRPWFQSLVLPTTSYVTE